MPTSLDCSNIESSVLSLETILALDSQVIRDIIDSFNYEAYSIAHPQDYRHLSYILTDLDRSRGASTANPDIVYWFHGTRVLYPNTIWKSGLRSLHEQIDQIWDDLFELAKHWVSQDEWRNFRLTVESCDPLESSQRHRQRLGNTADSGPHAVLIRDAVAVPDRFGGVNYLSAPETVEDLCNSFKTHYRKDLLAKFRTESVPCIVKFYDRCRRDDLLGFALSYLWCSRHSEECIGCNVCFEPDGYGVLAEAIVEVQELSQ